MDINKYIRNIPSTFQGKQAISLALLFVSVAIIGLLLAASLGFFSQTESEETPILDRPFKAFIDTSNNTMHVLNRSNFITILDMETLLPIDILRFDEGVTDMAFNQNVQKIYTIDDRENTLTIIDVKRKEREVISVGLGPTQILLNTIDNKVYVLNHRSGDISVIDGFSDKIVATILIEGETDAINILPGLNILYAISSKDKILTIIDMNRNNTRVVSHLDFRPSIIFVTPSGSGLYIKNVEGDKIIYADVLTGIVKKEVTSFGIARSTSLSMLPRETLYVSNHRRDTGNIVAVDMKNNTRRTLDIEGTVRKVRELDGKVFVLSATHPRLTVIDERTHEALAHIELPNIYHRIFQDLFLGKIILFSNLSEITVIDMDTYRIIGSISGDK